MPIHSFVHEASGETIDVYVPASAPAPEHQLQVRDGREYRRVYAAPLAAKDTQYGDASLKDFSRKTSDKSGLKVGDMWEISREMSDRRRQRDGVDVVRERYYEKYEQEYGEKHADVVQRDRLERANRTLNEYGIRVNL